MVRYCNDFLGIVKYLKVRQGIIAMNFNSIAIKLQLTAIIKLVEIQELHEM